MADLKNRALKPPVSLRRSLDVDDLCSGSFLSKNIILGSFWPNTASSFESSLVKSFKECSPVRDHEPHISRLCEFYADRILERLAGERFEWIARVMSSAEIRCDSSRPGDRLVEILCSRLNASNVTSILYKSDSRPSMRSISRLSGPDALRPRIEYVLQDLFIKPCELGGRILLLDDIYNTGASMRVYAAAFLKYARVEAVVGVNLAATRFNRGKDGHGMLKLDISAIEESPCLRPVHVIEDTYHLPCCEDITSRSKTLPLFKAQSIARPCPKCLPEKKTRPWYQFW